MKILCMANNVPGVNLYRVYQQAHALQKAGHEVYTLAPRHEAESMDALGLTWVLQDWLAWVDKNRPDVIYANYSADMERLAGLVMVRDRLRIPFIVDYDDHFEGLPSYNQATMLAPQGSTRRVFWRAWLKEASALTTTTATLRDLSGRPAHVVPNFAMPELYAAAPQKHDTVRILFSGASAGRWAEMCFLEPIVTDIVKTYDHVRFIFTGAMPDWALALPRVFATAWCGVPGYFRLLKHLAPDIGLAPLVDNDFNRSKSAIKYYEYAMIGAAGVYSDLAPYSEVRTGVTGLVVPNDQAAWRNAIARLVDTSVLRSVIAANASADVMRSHTGSDALESLMKRVCGNMAPKEVAYALP